MANPYDGCKVWGPYVYKNAPVPHMHIQLKDGKRIVISALKYRAEIAIGRRLSPYEYIVEGDKNTVHMKHGNTTTTTFLRCKDGSLTVVSGGPLVKLAPKTAETTPATPPATKYNSAKPQKVVTVTAKRGRSPNRSMRDRVLAQINKVEGKIAVMNKTVKSLKVLVAKL